MAADKTSRRTIKAVETTFSVVRQLEANGKCQLTELAEALDMPNSTVHKHLQTLKQEGYVRVEDGKYKLGFKFLKHGGSVRDRCRIYSFGRSTVEKLGDQLDEMVFLSVREGNRGVFLFCSNDRYNLQDLLPLGERYYLHQTAAGKAMLAELNEEFVREYIGATGLPRESEATLTDPDELIEELTEIKRNGYALYRGERDSNVRAVSAAIRDGKTGQIGAISVAVPSGSPAVDNLDGEYAEAVREASSELSLQLKHN